MMNKECRVSGAKVLILFPRGGFVLHAFLESSCKGSWTQGKRLDLLLLEVGRQNIVVHRGNKRGEGRVQS